MAEQVQIMKDSPEAASIQTVTGWVSSTGMFFGNNEDLARYAGCTHMKCEVCGTVRVKNSYCVPCHDKARSDRWDAMPRADWNGTDLLYSETVDRFFVGGGSLIDYCEDEGVSPSELRLIICTPNLARQIDAAEHFCDDLPEDGDVPSEIAAAFDALNAALAACKEPLSWSPGKTRPTDQSIDAEMATD